MSLEITSKHHVSTRLAEIAGEIKDATPYPPLSEEGKYVIGGLRAEVLATPIAGRSGKVAEKIAKNPERGETIAKGVRGLLNRLLDTTIDPLDVINGLGENVSRMLQEVREGIVPSLVADTLMHVGERRGNAPDTQQPTRKRIDLDDVANLIMLANDFTSQSRDTRTKLFSFLYTGMYDAAVDDDTAKHPKRNRFLLPEPAVVKLAVTRQIERQEEVGLSFVERVLSLDAADTNLAQFQKLLAAALVAEMDSKPTAIREVLQRAADIGDKAIRTIENRLRAVIEVPERTKRRRYEDDKKEVLVTRYLQNSRKAYVEGVLAMAPQGEEINDPEQRVKWDKAVRSGKRLMDAYKKAQEILQQ